MSQPHIRTPEQIACMHRILRPGTDCFLIITRINPRFHELGMLGAARACARAALDMRCSNMSLNGFTMTMLISSDAYGYILDADLDKWFIMLNDPSLSNLLIFKWCIYATIFHLQTEDYIFKRNIYSINCTCTVWFRLLPLVWM